MGQRRGLEPEPESAPARRSRTPRPCYWNERSRRSSTVRTPAQLDGEYLDSLEGYVTAELNFRREHFRRHRPADLYADTQQPALFKGLAVYEFTRWISDDVHRLGRLMFANGVPYRFSFLCPWLDVLGTETDWLSGGDYQPVAGRAVCSVADAVRREALSAADEHRLRRVHAGPGGTVLPAQPVLRLLSVHVQPQRLGESLLAESGLVQPRPAAVQEIPPGDQEVAEAGWQPVTSAVLDPAGMPLERFGAGTNAPVYFTVLNDAVQPRTVVLRVDEAIAVSGAVATEMVSKQRLSQVAGGWEVAVPARSTAVVKLEPGPRFIDIQRTSGIIRLSIVSPSGIEQVLEGSENLQDWISLQTNTPLDSPYVTVITTGPSRQFMRLRW